MDWKKKLTAEYAARKRAAERAVVTREWATGPLYDIAPRIPSAREPKIRRLRAASTKSGTNEFGFDDARRLRVIRRHAGRRGCAYETFVDWEGNAATAVGYDYDPNFKVAMSLGVLVSKSGRPVKHTHRFAGGTVVTRYEYRGDRLVTIRVTTPDGREQVHRPKSIAVPPPAPAVDQRQLFEVIETLLVAKTPAAVRKAAARSKSPTWCCGLVFDRTVPQLPPEVAIATVNERAAMGRTSIWNCAAWDGLGAAWVADRALDRACKSASDQLRVGDGSQVSALVVRVAQRLNRVARAAFGNVADEFVVFAFDRDRPAKALLETSLAPAQRTKLKRLRLL